MIYTQENLVEFLDAVKKYDDGVKTLRDSIDSDISLKEHEHTDLLQKHDAALLTDLQALSDKENEFLDGYYEVVSKEMKKHDDAYGKASQLFIQAFDKPDQRSQDNPLTPTLINDIMNELHSEKEQSNQYRDEQKQRIHLQLLECEKEFEDLVDAYQNKRDAICKKNDDELREYILEKAAQYKDGIAELDKEIKSVFPEIEMEESYLAVLENELSMRDFKCASIFPERVIIGNISARTGLSDYAINAASMVEKANEDPIRKTNYMITADTAMMLRKYYRCVFRIHTDFSAIIEFPRELTFDKTFNTMLNVSTQEQHDGAIYAVNSLVMKLFEQIPPTKVTFSIIDAVTNGVPYVEFMKLVNPNDSTIKVMSGGTAHTKDAIKNRLIGIKNRIVEFQHQSLKGQYDNIIEYNRVAKQNAQPFTVLVIDNFPSGFDEDSLEVLKNILSTGYTCGVFCLLIKSESATKELVQGTRSNLQTLCDNVCGEFETEFTTRKVTSSGHILYYYWFVKENTYHIGCHFPKPSWNDSIVAELTRGIASAESIKMPFADIVPKEGEWLSGNSTDGLDIPIGIIGAGEIQRLKVGLSNDTAHHALIIGQTGSGKSNLMHVIIMSALLKYPQDELQIYLVDYKDGVEFKIYANYPLGIFRVIALESERELGVSVLNALKREKEARSEKFHQTDVNDISDYRRETGEKMPRILLIIDEFHKLFSQDETSSSISNEAKEILSDIIKQGRGFGMHTILATQSIGGSISIGDDVWNQVGIRIALKCSPADASFVLGADNKVAEAISQNEPGKAIYNSSLGERARDSEFRTAYIDKKEQEKYLSKLFNTSPYSTNTRVILSDVESNIFSPYNMFINGKDFDFSQKAVYVGESLDFDVNMRVVFEKSEYFNNNALVMGDNEQKPTNARALFTFSVMSFLLHILHTTGAPQSPVIHIFDYKHSRNNVESDPLNTIKEAFPQFVSYYGRRDNTEGWVHLYRELMTEQPNDAPRQHYVMVFGLHKAGELAQNNMDAMNSEDYDEDNNLINPALIFKEIVNGSVKSDISLLVWGDSYKSFASEYNDGFKKNFGLKFAFNMPDDESLGFIRYSYGSKLKATEALLDADDDTIKFRPYKLPDIGWVKRFCDKINESYKNKNIVGVKQ